MRTTRPLISAVIIARNEEATIRRCITSVLSQSVRVSEVIIVDGNSTDGTVRIVSDLANQNPHVRLVIEDPAAEERGPAAARNTGAALASGELVLFLNGDVTIGQDYVARLLWLMDEGDLDAAAGLRWNVRNSLVSGLMNVHYALNYDTSADTLASPAFLSGDAMLVKAESFWGVGGYDAGMPAGEDADLGYRLRGAGKKIGYEPSATIWHEGRHYRSFGDWLQQLQWYGRGAASLARAHSWRMERERTGLYRHILLPLSALLTLMLLMTVASSMFAPLGYVIGFGAAAGAGLRYMVAASRVHSKCSSVSLPTLLLPQDVFLYPLFKAFRYAALSGFTWHALSADARPQGQRRSQDGAV